MSRGEKMCDWLLQHTWFEKKSTQEKTCSAHVSLISAENVMNVSIAWHKKKTASLSHQLMKSLCRPGSVRRRENTRHEEECWGRKCALRGGDDGEVWWREEVKIKDWLVGLSGLFGKKILSPCDNLICQSTWRARSPYPLPSMARGTKINRCPETRYECHHTKIFKVLSTELLDYPGQG